MKAFTLFAVVLFSFLLVSSTSNIPFAVSAQDGKKPPETIILAKEAKLGQVSIHRTRQRGPQTEPLRYRWSYWKRIPMQLELSAAIVTRARMRNQNFCRRSRKSSLRVARSLRS